MTDVTTSAKIFQVLQSLFLVLVIFFICVAMYNILRRKWQNRHVTPTSRQLVIKESLILDTKRRLVRVQNRHIEHLLLLGSSEDLVIESYSIEQASRPEEHHPLEKN